MGSHSKTSKTTQLKRNERERKRVHQVNDGFDRLRLKVPRALANKKLSKADTLREAVKYIQQLQAMLTMDSGYPQPAFQCQPQYYQQESEFDMYFPSEPSTSPTQMSHGSTQNVSPTSSSCSGPFMQNYQIMHHSP